MDDEKKYFNFPITLLKDLIPSRDEVLCNILYYCLYAHADRNLTEGTEKQRMKASAKYFGVKLGNLDNALETGREVYQSSDGTLPIVGLKKSIYFDFYLSNKSEFESACLLAHLGLKSIIQKKAFCRVTNLFLLSRMDGSPCSVKSIDLLTDDVKRFSNEYQLKKIKSELMENWGLSYYGKTRGFYASYKLELDELAFQVEKIKKTKKQKFTEQKMKQEEARKKALERLALL